MLCKDIMSCVNCPLYGGIKFDCDFVRYFISTLDKLNCGIVHFHLLNVDLFKVEK